MSNFLRSIFHKNKSLWMISIVISLILFVIVVSQLDFQLLIHSITHDLNPNYLAIAILFLMFEGIMTALRIQLFSTASQTFYSALYANAWYVFFLIFLPARLGEIAGIYVLQKYMHQSRGASVMSIVLQRLLDLIVLSIIFILLITFSYNIFSTLISMIISISFIALLSALFKYRFELISYLAKHIANIEDVRKNPLLRVIFRTLLQARLWNKQFNNSQKLPLLLFITLLKWLFNLFAITLIFLSISTIINLSDSFLISVLYNFLAVIPIQTIGGIGIGEAGLTALFINLSQIPLTSAVAISIFFRAIIILFPLLFFLFAYSYNRYCLASAVK